MTDLDKHVTEAMHRIEELYYETDGKCYVSFSGGKDSTVLLALIKLCEDIYTIPKDGIPAVFADTGIEMGVTLDFVRWVKDNWYPNVQIIRPGKSFDWCVKHYGKPVKSKLKAELLHRWQAGRRTEYVRSRLITGVSKDGTPMKRTRIADKDMHMVADTFHIKVSGMCCDILKKKPVKRYADIHGVQGEVIGLRTAEGGARELRAKENVKHGARICTSIDKKGFVKKAPLIDWPDEAIEEFIQKYNVPLSDAYTKYGFHRTGCMACPFALDVDKNLQYLHDHEPNRYKAAMHWLKDVYIAQNVILPFDSDYETERAKTWRELYEPMRQEMLRKYRPNSRLIKDGDQLSIFDILGVNEDETE